MGQLDRYLFRTVAFTTILACAGLLGILTIFTVLEQLEDMQKSYTFSGVMRFSLLSIPRMFYETLPYGALIGCLSGLGMLASNSELVVMRAAGVSTWTIARSAIVPAVLLAAFGLAIGEYVLPDVEKAARIGRLQGLTGNDDLPLVRGTWYREGNTFMRFDEVETSGQLKGVTHYEYDEDNRIVRTLYANRGVWHDVREDEKYWLLEKVRITELSDNRTRVKREESYRWDTDLAPDLIATEIGIRPDKMSMSELGKRIEFQEAQDLDSGKYELGYWQKVLQPLATVALVFVAISFVFGPLRESNIGMRVVTGLVIGIVFKFVQDLLSPASLVFGFAPAIAILIPIALCFVVGWVLMRRAG